MEKNKELKSNLVERCYKGLTAPKTIKICGYLAMILFFGLFIAAIIVALPPGPGPGVPAYNILDNWISDMGNHDYTPAPILLDSALISTGILMIPFHFYIEKYVAPIPATPEDLPAPNRWVYRLTGLAFLMSLMGSIGMIGVGIFSEDRSYGLHFPLSVLLFGSYAFSAMFLGAALTIEDQILVPKPFNYILGAYGIHGLRIVGFLAGYHIFIGTSYEILMEWIILFALLGWMLPLSFFALRHANKEQETKKS